MKCDICDKKIQETFLKKILGTVVKNEKGKKHYICQECQSNLKNDKKEILTKL